MPHRGTPILNSVRIPLVDGAAGWSGVTNGSWKEAWQSVGITEKELLPIVIACALWGQYWAHCQVQVWCNNAAVVHILDKLTSKDPIIMHLLRCLHFSVHILILHYGPDTFRGRRISKLTHSLVTNLLQVFFKELPTAKEQTRIPQSLWELLVISKLDWLSPSWKELLNSSLKEAWHQRQPEATAQPKNPISTSADDWHSNLSHPRNTL